MPRLNLPSWPVMLGIPARYDAQLARIAEMDRAGFEAGLRPSLGERVSSAIKAPSAFFFGYNPVPPQPPGAPASTPDWANPDAVTRGDYYTLVDGLPMIAIDGVLTPRGYYDWCDEKWVAGYRQIIASVRAAKADGHEHLFVAIDSPGGLVQGGMDASDALRSLMSGMAVVGHASLMASAAMMLGAQIPNLYAEQVASVGSIGVRIGFFDMEGWLERMGDRRHDFMSGRLKDMGSPFRAPTKEEAGLFKAEVLHWADGFYRQVAAGRGIDLETLRETNGWEAKVFTAGGPPDLDPEAVDLIDGVLTQEQAFSVLRDLAAAGGRTFSSVPATGRAGAQSDPEAAAPENMEDTMSLLAKFAALKAKADGGDPEAAKELTSLRALLAQDQSDDDGAEGEDTGDDDAGGEGEDGDDAEGENDGDDDAGAEGEDDDAEGEDEAEDDAEARAAAVLNSKEAKGREGLAGRLAVRVASGKLSVADALADLNAAPRTSRLDTRMSGNGGGAKPDSGQPGKGKTSALVADAMARNPALKDRLTAAR